MTSPDPHARPAPVTAWERVREAAFQAFKAGQPDEAEALLLQAVREAEAPDADPSGLISALQALAHLYEWNHGDWADRHRKCEATLTRLLAVQEAALGDQHPDLAGTLQALAWEIGKCRQAERAEALYRRALAIDEATFDPTHPHLADSLRVLGVRLFFSKRYLESVEILERARSIVEGRSDRESLSALDALLGCLELAYTAWERFAESEQVLLRHLQLAEQRGRVCHAQGKHAEADAAYQRAMLLNDRWFESNRRAKRFRADRRPDGPHPDFARPATSAEADCSISAASRSPAWDARMRRDAASPRPSDCYGSPGR